MMRMGMGNNSDCPQPSIDCSFKSLLRQRLNSNSAGFPFKRKKETVRRTGRFLDAGKGRERGLS